MSKSATAMKTLYTYTLFILSFAISIQSNGQISAAPPTKLSTTLNTLSAGDEKWDSTFATPGVNAGIYTIITDGLDSYVGGVFNKAGGIAASNVAKLKNGVWSALGAGIPGPFTGVFDLQKIGSFLYAASNNGVFKWDGATWTNIGPVSGSIAGNLGVYSLAADVNGNLYAVGDFTSINNVVVNGVAKWNGSLWTALGAGLQNPNAERIIDVETMGNNVFVSGGFQHMGYTAASNVARWDGTDWYALGSGLTGTGVANIEVLGSNLYAAGGFNNAGGVAVSQIARWDGSNWNALGSGLTADQTVQCIYSDGNNIYVAGDFTNAGTVPVNGLAKWNGTVWDSVSTNGLVLPTIETMAIAPGLFLAGGFTDLNPTLDMQNIAQYKDSSWTVLGNGTGVALTEFVNCVAVDGNNIYVGGSFTRIGGLATNSIAKWDGRKWSALGSGLGSTVYDIVVKNNKVYAGGSFTNKISVWDGISWTAVGGGANSTVNALAFDGTDLYAAGDFSTAGGVAANGIARWNGTNWAAVGTGVNGSVKDLLVDSGSIYAAGNFTVAGGVLASRVAKYSGGVWSKVGDGFQSSPVFCLAMNPAHELYAGGSFIVTGNGQLVNGISKFNGTSWVSLGTGMSSNATVYGINFNGSDLYVAGDFSTAGGTTANNIAKWNGAGWSTLGSGLGKDPGGYSISRAVVIKNNRLLVGGYFAYAGGKREDRFSSYAINSITPAAFPLCPGGVDSIKADVSGSSYQWQVNTGSGFTNITDNANYSGTSSSTLYLINLPSTWYGYQYRCVSGADLSSIYSLNFTNGWTGAVNNLWSVPGNWSCGKVPDGNSNVIIGPAEA